MTDDRRFDVALTYDDYRRMPEGERYELLEGDLQLTPAPNPRHQAIVFEIGVALRDHVERGALGKVYLAPIDVILSQTTVVQPDVLFISRERAGIVGPDAITAAPDLVVEVLSPNSAQRDRVTKRRLYGRYGVREYWIVDPEARSIEVCSHDGRELVTHGVWQAGMELGSPLLQGFRLEVAAIFA